MGSVSHELPLSLHLPSGLAVRIARGRRKVRGSPDEAGATLAGQLAALSGDLADVTHESGRPVDLAALSLEDFHVLRTVATAAGLFPEAPVKRRCHNCDEILTVSLAASVPLGPILDGELDDSEYDEPFDFARAHSLVRGVDPDEPSLAARLSPLTVAQAAELWAVTDGTIGADRRRLGRRLGLAQLGDATDPRRIARKLDKLSDEFWDRLLDLFEAAHYSPRLTARVVCPACDAENTFLAPRVRELPELADQTEPVPEPADMAGFPSPDAFFAAMEDHARRLTEAAGIDPIPVFLEQGVPHVDEGGVPLLGSYTPPPERADDSLRPATGEVRLYYRTFRNQWLDEGPYDVDAEIAETIEHELQHHVAFLRGWDETDAEERAQIVEERRRVRGREETKRARADRERSFLERTWPLWAILLLLAALTYFGQDAP